MVTHFPLDEFPKLRLAILMYLLHLSVCWTWSGLAPFPFHTLVLEKYYGIKWESLLQVRSQNKCSEATLRFSKLSFTGCPNSQRIERSTALNWVTSCRGAVGIEARNTQEWVALSDPISAAERRFVWTTTRAHFYTVDVGISEGSPLFSPLIFQMRKQLMEHSGDLA